MSDYTSDYQAYLLATTAWRRAEQAFRDRPTVTALEALEAAETAHRDARLAYDKALLSSIYS